MRYRTMSESGTTNGGASCQDASVGQMGRKTKLRDKRGGPCAAEMEP
jgi:hypothetical protein